MAENGSAWPAIGVKSTLRGHRGIGSCSTVL